MFVFLRILSNNFFCLVNFKRFPIQIVILLGSFTHSNIKNTHVYKFVPYRQAIKIL